jgi:hypothetical protein
MMLRGYIVARSIQHLTEQGWLPRFLNLATTLLSVAFPTMTLEGALPRTPRHVYHSTRGKPPRWILP